MSYFVVAGMPDCHLYNHVRLIADILSDNFPNFKVQYIQLELAAWKTWVKKVNLENDWCHLTSPLVWKELTMKGGKKHLIGGASEFWEYCYDYYNLESILTNKELDQLVADMKQYLENKAIEDELQKSKEEKMIICIDTNKSEKNLLHILVLALSQKLNIFSPKEVILRLVSLDFSCGDPDADLLLDKIQCVNNFKQGLENADLLILIGDYTRDENEELYTWLQRNRYMMQKIADEINIHAKPSLRVIVAVNGPVCFNATILFDNITRIHLHNIVAETASSGLEILSLVAKTTDMPLENMSGPPVWGFTGINQLIDLEHIVQRYDVYRPNVRAPKNHYNSTLELGKRHTELRFFSYLGGKFKNVWIKLKDKRSNMHYNTYISSYAKVRGIIVLIETWYSPHSQNIMSVGIMSNGTFGIPNGLVFSQPAMLKNNRWTPVDIFPMPRKDPCDVEDLIPFTLEIYKRFRLRTSRGTVMKSFCAIEFNPFKSYK